MNDADGDGYGADVDCDDTSSAISPGAEESCNGFDDDCDGLVDEAGAVDGTAWYPDADGDGYGDLAGGALWCEQPAGTVADGSDCDDATAAVSPAADEVCDGVDNNCDGTADEPGAVGGIPAHPDLDGDGYGDDAISINVCELGDGYVANNADCDDTSTLVRPDADEVCDDVDNDCNGEVDDDASDAKTWYLDGDDDGYGIAETTTRACDEPDGYARKKGDCDDDSSRVNPGEDEVCDGVDNDCDGTSDVDAVDADTWYVDTDGDGYGAPDTALTQCESPGEDYVVLGGDCDESDTEVNPGVEETWYDGLDEDCDGASDYDQDSDGYVSADLTDEDAPTYDPGTGEVIDDGSETEGGDCDDENNRINPGRSERCNDVDDNCDGEVDNDAIDAGTYYVDEDDDSYGDDATALVTCEAPTGDYIRVGGDCDDSDASVNPGASESCDDSDGLDNDCDGSVDEVCYDGALNYQEGFGADATSRDCDQNWSAVWELSADACPDCEYTFSVAFTFDRDTSMGRTCWKTSDFNWTLGLDTDYAGTDEAVLWYPYTYDYYYYGYDDDVDYDTGYTAPAPAVVVDYPDYDGGGGSSGSPVSWYPRFDADWDPGTGRLSFWDGYYEYAYSYGRTTYYWTDWYYGTVDLAGIGG